MRLRSSLLASTAAQVRFAQRRLAVGSPSASASYYRKETQGEAPLAQEHGAAIATPRKIDLLREADMLHVLCHRKGPRGVVPGALACDPGCTAEGTARNPFFYRRLSATVVGLARF